MLLAVKEHYYIRVYIQSEQILHYILFTYNVYVSVFKSVVWSIDMWIQCDINVNNVK